MSSPRCFQLLLSCVLLLLLLQCPPTLSRPATEDADAPEAVKSLRRRRGHDSSARTSCPTLSTSNDKLQQRSPPRPILQPGGRQSTASAPDGLCVRVVHRPAAAHPVGTNTRRSRHRSAH
ncbi:hypothetical protein FQN60_005234 [Etheostoma spectabile]|uniref:Secreted protein n=1 Tax=Etheostoma spectabile TaxID=54343 RepID=A0A5J5DMB0_9PERO|nr:hypothetical protein FQN60_005234 [Etheostoma spectabile]